MNYSWTTGGLWRIMKPLLPSNVIARIAFPDKSPAPTFFDADKLLTDYGGTLDINGQDQASKNTILKRFDPAPLDPDTDSDDDGDYADADDMPDEESEPFHSVASSTVSRSLRASQLELTAEGVKTPSRRSSFHSDTPSTENIFSARDAILRPEGSASPPSRHKSALARTTAPQASRPPPVPWHWALLARLTQPLRRLLRPAPHIHARYVKFVEPSPTSREVDASGSRRSFHYIYGALLFLTLRSAWLERLGHRISALLGQWVERTGRTRLVWSRVPPRMVPIGHLVNSAAVAMRQGWSESAWVACRAAWLLA
jgi:hypothetical protein